MSFAKILGVGWLLLFISGKSFAVYWREDLKAAPILTQAEFKHTGRLLYTSLGVFGGSGVWLGGEWFLTARHAIAGWQPGALTVDLPNQGGKFSVKEIHLSPDAKADLALLRLREAPKDASKLSICNDGEETKGKRIWFVGYGNYGPAGDFQGVGKLQGGNNVIDEVAQHTTRFSFSRPPQAETFEACPALLDSGGPVFLEVNGKLYLTGVIIRVTERAAPGYGAKARFARLSPQRAWLRKMIER